MSERPCICGCSYDDHEEIKFRDSTVAILYCNKCGQKPPSWCYNYTPIDNLKYLEWLDKKRND